MSDPGNIGRKRLRVAVLRSHTDLATNRTGGGRYLSLAVEALREVCDVEVHHVYYRHPTHDGVLRRLVRFAGMARAVRAHLPEADVYLLDRRTLFLVRRRPGRRYVALTHHYDPGGPPWKRVLQAVSTRVGLRKADVLVVVSRYWADYFRALGARDVRVVYNAFAMPRFDAGALEDFRRRHGLDDGRPIVYLGVNAPVKGVRVAYEQLKGRGYHLAASGPRGTDLPVRHLDLPYAEYLKLLAVSSVAVLMTELPEGWCRTAHEAMLVGTPVIGSGRAGMGELLEGGGQILCRDAGELPALVSHLLADADARERLGSSGRAYAARFTVGRFREAWTGLVCGQDAARSLIPETPAAEASVA